MIENTSPQKIVKAVGVLYLIIILAGVVGETFVRNKLVVSVDATGTASNIRASKLPWRMGIASDLVMHIGDVPLMVIFY